MRLVYVGPHDEVFVPALDDLAFPKGEAVEAGESPEVESLLEQATFVLAVEEPAKQPKALKAPAKED